MYTAIATPPRPAYALGFWPDLDAPRRPSETLALPRERAWREAPAQAGGMDAGSIVASHWIDERTTARVERNVGPAGQYVIGVALRPVRIRLEYGTGTAYEGVMPTGTVHVTEPGQAVEAEFFGPCDFVHFHVATEVVNDRQAAARMQPGSSEGVERRSLRGLLARDELAAQLSRTLTKGEDGSDPLYVQSIGQTVLMRVLALRSPPPRVGALPKWRLRRVQEHLAAKISEPISLADLAEAAGLSRMHFAAQFRVATGCRPHDYLLQQRIERAKEMLATTDTPLVEVALSVGFQTQSHFSTVFKRLAGDTPARWQRNMRAA